MNWGPRAVTGAIDIVLERAQHTQFLIRKLWGEFIAGPIPQAKLDALSAEYRANGYKLKPLIRGILMSPEIFESIDEPNLIKPPIIYMVGVLRQLAAPMKHTQLQGPMNNMQQRIYKPPNVAGWEGGMSWLNTNTVQARFDMVRVAQYLRYSNFYRNTETPVPAAKRQLPGRRGRGDGAGRVRARLRLGRQAVDLERDARQAPGLRGHPDGSQPDRHRSGQHHGAPDALLRVASDDPRRT